MLTYRKCTWRYGTVVSFWDRIGTVVLEEKVVLSIPDRNASETNSEWFFKGMLTSCSRVWLFCNWLIWVFPPYLCLCGMRMHAYLLVCMRIHRCVRVWRPEVYLDWFPSYSLKQGLSLQPRLHQHVIWLVSLLRGSPLNLPSTEISVVCHLHGFCGSELQYSPWRGKHWSALSPHLILAPLLCLLHTCTPSAALRNKSSLE